MYIPRDYPVTGPETDDDPKQGRIMAKMIDEDLSVSGSSPDRADRREHKLMRGEGKVTDNVMYVLEFTDEGGFKPCYWVRLSRHIDDSFEPWVDELYRASMFSAEAQLLMALQKSVLENGLTFGNEDPGSSMRIRMVRVIPESYELLP